MLVERFWPLYRLSAVTWLTQRSSASCRILDGKYHCAPSDFIPGQAAAPNTAEIVVGELQRSNPKHRHRATPPKSRRRTLVHAAGSVVAVATLLVTGSGYWVAHGALGGITVSQALSAEDPTVQRRRHEHPADRARLAQRPGRQRPALESILKHLHAGDSDDGGYNTNTLILVMSAPTTKSSPSPSPAMTGCPSTVSPATTTSRSKRRTASPSSTSPRR